MTDTDIWNTGDTWFVIVDTFLVVIGVIICFIAFCVFTAPIDDPIIIVYQSNSNTDLNYYLSYDNNCSIVMVYIDDVMIDINYNARECAHKPYTIHEIDAGNHTVKIVGIKTAGQSTYTEYVLYNDTFIFV